MAVFGFIILSSIATLLTFGFLVSFLYLMNQYNIGGVPHTWKDRVILIPMLFVVCLLWYFIITNSPISISLTS